MTATAPAERAVRDLSLVPLGVFLAVFLGGSVLFVLAQSLGYAPWYGRDSFPDLRAYQAVLARPEFAVSFGLTLFYALFATSVSMVLGSALALSTRGPVRRSRLVQRVIELPLVLPYGVGIALAVLMMGNGGLVSRLLAQLGLISAPGDFVRLLDTHAGWGVMAVYVWKQTPFVAVAVAAALHRPIGALEEAARVLGARPAQVLTHVTLPAIAPALASAGLIGFAFNVGAFEAPLILGGGHPRVLPVIAWELLSDPDATRQLEAMAIVVMLAGVVIVAGMAGVLLRRRLDPSSEAR